MQPTEKKPHIAVRVAVIIGVIVVLFLISLAVIRFVPRALSSLGNVSVTFSSLFRGSEKIDLSLSPSTITSGQKTAITFNHSNKKDEGYYTLAYPCDSKGQLSYESGANNVVISCDAPYPFSSADNTISLIGKSSATGQTNIPITISFVKASSTNPAVSGKGTLTISDTTPSTPNVTVTTPSTNNNSTVTTPKPTTTTPKPVATNPYARADLSVRIVGTPIYSGENNATVSFEVRNIGDKASGAWTIRTTQPMQNYADSSKYVPNNPSLAAGASTGIMTLTLTGVNPAGGVVTINVTASGDYVTANNTAQITLQPTYGGGYGNTYSDLEIRLVNTAPNYGYNGQTQVRFTVKNIGGRDSGNYTITANVPNSTQGNFTSYQPSLRPGQTADFTMNFNSYQNYNDYTNGYNNTYSNNVVTITVTPNGGYYENNTGNNSVTVYLNNY